MCLMCSNFVDCGQAFHNHVQKQYDSLPVAAAANAEAAPIMQSKPMFKTKVTGDNVQVLKKLFKEALDRDIQCSMASAKTCLLST